MDRVYFGRLVKILEHCVIFCFAMQFELFLNVISVISLFQELTRLWPKKRTCLLSFYLFTLESGSILNTLRKLKDLHFYIMEKLQENWKTYFLSHKIDTRICVRILEIFICNVSKFRKQN